MVGLSDKYILLQFIVFVCVFCLHVYALCAVSPGGQKRVIRSPGAAVWVLEPNVGSLKEQQMLLTIEPSPQTHIFSPLINFHTGSHRGWTSLHFYR